MFLPALYSMLLLINMDIYKFRGKAAELCLLRRGFIPSCTNGKIPEERAVFSIFLLSYFPCRVPFLLPGVPMSPLPCTLCHHSLVTSIIIVLVLVSWNFSPSNFKVSMTSSFPLHLYNIAWCNVGWRSTILLLHISSLGKGKEKGQFLGLLISSLPKRTHFMNPDLIWGPSLKLRAGKRILITLQKKEAAHVLSQARSQSP